MHLIKSGILFFLVLLCFSCKKDKPEENEETPVHLQKGILVLNEGLFQQNNSSLSWINLSNDNVLTDFFMEQNGRLLGDTGNDLEMYGSKIYVIVNNSNTIEVLSKYNGKSLKQIQMLNGSSGKQPRSIAFYGSNAYITCYDGYVDVLDTTNLNIVQRIQVGSNPEGLAVSNGKLFVANSGGLNFPNVDSTVSVINLSNHQEISKITVGKNPGSVKVDSQGDVYVITRGDYASIPSRMVRIDPSSNSVVQTFTFDASGIERMNDHFLISNFNYTSSSSEVLLFNTLTESVENSSFINTSEIATLYGVHYSSQKNKIYCMDAMGYTNTGYVRQFSASGVYEKSYHVGLNPSKILIYE